ncbi:MAG: HAD-IC family P-type ATPase [Calothrix sp. C42_A2020_038]|nr:HAD-IC family P-type ATPase [Calothrix sp. C42_A2020_038]
MTAINIDKPVTDVHPLADTEWHNLDISEVVSILGTDLHNGLNHTEVNPRQALYGVNELTVNSSKSWSRLIQQFQQPQPFIYILLLLGFVEAVIGSWRNAAAILGVIVLNVIINYVEELKAEEVISALAKAGTTQVTVVRDGKKHRIRANELVPGDLVLLTYGSKVPADLRLISANNLQVDESFFASFARNCTLVRKNTRLLSKDTPLAERDNIAYTGSFVKCGQGSGIVIATGNNTQISLLSQPMSARFGFNTSLTRKFTKFSQNLTYIILFLASFTFILGIGFGKPWRQMFDGVVALAVSAIPQGLSAVTTIILVTGIERMARRHVLIRNLSVLETLGSTTVICSDKTGTLTENQITVQLIYADGQYTLGGIGYNPKGTIWYSDNLQPVHFGGRFLPTSAVNTKTSGGDSYTTNNKYISHMALKECLVAGLLCNNSHLEPRGNQWVVVGDSTEGAFIVSARKAGLSQSKHREAMPRLDIIPFDSKYQYMATLHKSGNENLLTNNSELNQKSFNTIYIKGSVEAILSRSQQAIDKYGNLTPLNHNFIEQEAETLAKQGLRVFAFAKKIVAGNCNIITHDSIASDLIFLGLQAMIDPGRQDVAAAIKSCHSAGIKVKMITGEHVTTAVAIGYKLGLSKNAEITAFQGEHLAVMNDTEIKEAVETGVVFARVTPDQKLHLVQALQNNGEIVAVTGNGVNDTPALKKADIGIAMGKAGTDVAKESADILLTNDNFVAIKAAIEEGRSIYQNLHKVIAFILPVNFSESMTVLIAALIGLQLPILPIHILWLNIINMIMTVSLAFEPKSNYLMKRSQAHQNKSFLSKRLLWRILLISALNWIIIFGIFEWSYRTFLDVAIAQTMAIQALMIARIVYLLSISHWKNIIVNFQDQMVPDEDAPAIALAAVTSIILQFMFSQWSVMNTLLATTSLNLNQWLICLIPALIMIPVAIVTNQFNCQE